MNHQNMKCLHKYVCAEVAIRSLQFLYTTVSLKNA